MSKAAKPSPKPRKPAAAKAPRKKVGRDLFGAIVVGAGVAVALAWMGSDTSSARSFIERASARVQELASDLSQKQPSTDDTFPVSSIGDKTRTKPSSPRRYPICAGAATRGNCVVDGDTFYMDGVTIRVSDIDAPETHPPRCAYEADLGDRATVRLSQLLSAGPFQLVRQNRDTDKYGRQLRIVIREGRSLGKIMVGEGLVRPWTGKRRPWCDGENAAG